MGEAVWYVIEADFLVVCGALLALMVILSVLLILFEGDRFDFWTAWNRSKGGGTKRLDLD